MSSVRAPPCRPVSPTPHTLSRAGVTHVIFFEGSNDIARGATVGQITTGLTEVYPRAKAAGLKIIGATVIPRHNAAWNPAAMNPVRHAVNAWIRSNPDLDAVLDFDELVKDPSDPDHINPCMTAATTSIRTPQGTRSWATRSTSRSSRTSPRGPWAGEGGERCGGTTSMTKSGTAVGE